MSALMRKLSGCQVAEVVELFNKQTTHGRNQFIYLVVLLSISYYTNCSLHYSCGCHTSVHDRITGVCELSAKLNWVVSGETHLDLDLDVLYSSLMGNCCSSTMYIAEKQIHVYTV